MKRKLLYLAVSGWALLGCAEAKPQNLAQKGSHKGKGHVNSSGKFTPNSPATQKGKIKLTQEEARAKLQQALKLVPIGDDKFRLGKVKIDKKKRTVTIPVKVNMRSGVVEYALVTENGKVHESVFTTSASPTNVHLACVLLGKGQVKAGDWPTNYRGISNKQATKVEVTWPTNGPPKRYPLAQCVVKKDMNNAGKKEVALTTGNWLYNGSLFREGVFVAQSEGSLISIIGDSAALINGLRKDHTNDLIHSVNASILPPKGSTIKLILTVP